MDDKQQPIASLRRDRLFDTWARRGKAHFCTDPTILSKPTGRTLGTDISDNPHGMSRQANIANASSSCCYCLSCSSSSRSCSRGFGHSNSAKYLTPHSSTKSTAPGLRMPPDAGRSARPETRLAPRRCGGDAASRRSPSFTSAPSPSSSRWRQHQGSRDTVALPFYPHQQLCSCVRKRIGFSL